MFIGNPALLRRAYRVEQARKRGIVLCDAQGREEKILYVWFGGVFAGIWGASAGLEFEHAGLAGPAHMHVILSVGGMNAIACSCRCSKEAIEIYCAVAAEVQRKCWNRFDKACKVLNVLKMQVGHLVDDSILRRIEPNLYAVMIEARSKKPVVLDVKTADSPTAALYAGMSLPRFTSPVLVNGTLCADCAWTDITETLHRLICGAGATGVIFILNRASQFREVSVIMDKMTARAEPKPVRRLWGERPAIYCSENIPFCAIGPSPAEELDPITTDVARLRATADNASRFVGGLIACEEGALPAELVS